jgi:hypothetical protein
MMKPVIPPPKKGRPPHAASKTRRRPRKPPPVDDSADDDDNQDDEMTPARMRDSVTGLVTNSFNTAGDFARYLREHVNEDEADAMDEGVDNVLKKRTRKRMAEKKERSEAKKKVKRH